MAKSMGISVDWMLILKVLAWILLFIIGWPLIKNAVNWFRNKQNLDSAVSGAAGGAASLDPAAGATRARALKIQGWADSLKKLFNSWSNQSTSVVEILNATLNAEEVVALSSYYASTYNESLLAKVNEELGSSMNWFGKGWNDLREYVKQNLI